MSRGPQSGVRESAITKALKGALKAGLKVDRVEIGADGRIVVYAERENSAEGHTVNPWDAVK
jgi:hypothetical protein